MIPIHEHQAALARLTDELRTEQRTPAEVQPNAGNTDELVTARARIVELEQRNKALTEQLARAPQPQGQQPQQSGRRQR